MAHILPTNISEASPAARDASVSTLYRAQASSSVTPTGSVRAKRDQVSVACRPCRQKKAKCDALRPCTPCIKKNMNCQYETMDGETHSQATKRKYDEIARSHNVYAELFEMLATRSEQDAAKILERIRSGDQARAILNAMQPDRTNVLRPDPNRIAYENFLIGLAHSTGSLRAIINLAVSTLDPSSKMRVPDPLDFHVFRNRIVRLSYIENLIRRPQHLLNGLPAPRLIDAAPLTNPQAGASFNESHDLSGFDNLGSDDHPPHKVPAVPWTTMTASDEAVSHLVSLFLAWINPTWRFVEQDLFLHGMRSRWLRSDLCSPFLVNSICAIASLHSEHDVAFVGNDRNRITRGQQFHDEALRLWNMEEGRPSMTNIQALCVLSLESNYRAKDRLGLTLVPIALQLNDEVAVHVSDKRCAAQGVSRQDFARARLATHWTAKCTHVIMRIAFMSGGKVTPRVSGLPKINDVFKDEVCAWIGYPLTKESVPDRSTLYLRERCKLAELFQEMHDLFFPSGGQRYANVRDLVNAVDVLSAKMQHWYSTLPFELHYVWPMSIAVWELHVSYIAFLMTLWLVIRNRCQEDRDLQVNQSISNEVEDEAAFKAQVAREKLSSAIPLAHRAAQMMSDFRQRYGLKITPAWLLQLQAIAASVLMLDPELANPTIVLSPEAGELEGPIRDSRTAFDEVFRCLLGTGVEVMIARGIARMMYHTALSQKIILSRSTRTMLQIMSNTAWQPSDLSLVNSGFPDFTTIKGYGDSGGLTELLTSWETLEI